jgi:hypothetical protein
MGYANPCAASLLRKRSSIHRAPLFWWSKKLACRAVGTGIEIARIRYVGRVKKAGPRQTHTKRRILAVKDSLELLLIVRETRCCQEARESIGRVIAVVITSPGMAGPTLAS